KELVRLLLDKGADPNIIAGNGLTALDIADACGATPIVALLEEHGGRRTAESAKPSPNPELKPFEGLAADVARAFGSDDREALERIQAFAKRRATFHDVRSAVRRRLQKDEHFEGPISIAEARDVVAGFRGFASWVDLEYSVTRRDGGAKGWALPLYVVDEKHNRVSVRYGLEDEDWIPILQVIGEKKITGLDANGQMTDAMMERVAALEHITDLNLANSKRLTDAGLRWLARLPRLQHLNIGNAGITDRGLEVVGEVSSLRTFTVNWDGSLTDAGISNLGRCDALEDVDLMGSRTGDRTIHALAGKSALRRLATGTLLTDAGMASFRRFPAFATWSGSRPQYSLMSFRDPSTNLLLDGPFTNAGLTHLAGL